MRTLCYRAGALLVAGLLVMAGCGTPRETVTVSERPSTPEDTITSPTDTPSTNESVSSTVSVPSAYDTVQVGPFDRGKMWPFDQVPLDHFRSTYDMTVDSQWLKTAQRAALRFGEGCSASFASSDGLVLTNHHCARDALSAVSSGDSLLENGFYADSLGAERAVPDLHVDQLVEIEDATDRVNSGRGLSDRERRGRDSSAWGPSKI
jgi:Peptidase S46.